MTIKPSDWWWLGGIIACVFITGFFVGKVTPSPPPSPRAQDEAQKGTPHLVKITIKHKNIHVVDASDGRKMSLVDTEDGQRCKLFWFWGDPGETFYIRSDRLGDYIPPPEKDVLDIPTIPLSPKDKENKP